MGGRASRRKGHDWERAVAKRLRAIFGTAVRRGWQSRDGAEQPDVDGSPWWVECKRSKRPNIEAALGQAEDAAARANDGRAVMAVCKADGAPATVTLRLDDALDLIEEWYERGSR